MSVANTTDKPRSVSAAQSYEKIYGMTIPDVDRLTLAPRPAQLTLAGVHHAARPTWKLRETIVFYRDVLGLPLVHCISAKGWGPDNHPDFLHFFFDTGNGCTAAFFYYFGTSQPPELAPQYNPAYMATHVAWHATSRGQLDEWRAYLERSGVTASRITEHEIIDSLYFQDPNGYPLEITYLRRQPTVADADDASLTIRAALETLARAPGATIEDVWRAKAHLIRTTDLREAGK
jgi:catechol 2,3-dioxygenase-like lactoylglutathione lyase family enzyme